MAISKKSLGKVLAISMASAMAMSSLSAALVSVSAVQNPALASNGNVALNDDLSGVDVEEAIQNLIGTDEDNHLDAIVNGSFDLAPITTQLKAPGAIQYTDSNGVKRAVTVAADDITYRISGGGAKLNDAKTQIIASEKAGSATLTITVKGKVDLGGGKSEKSVTLKHTINIDVHDDGEFDLIARRAGQRLTESDLNDLAAYDVEHIEFSLIQYKDSGALAAAIADVKQGAPDANAKATAAQVKAKFAQKIAAGTEENKALYAKYQAQIEEQLDAAIAEASDKTAWDAVNLALTDATAAVNGYEVPLQATITGIVKQEQVTYADRVTEDGKETAWDDDVAKFVAADGAAIDGTAFNKVVYNNGTNDVAGDWYVVPEDKDISEIKKTGTEFGAAVEVEAGKYFTEVSGVTEVDPSASDNTFVVNNGKLKIVAAANKGDAGNTAVKVYKLNDKENVEIIAEANYGANEGETFKTDAIAAVQADSTNIQYNEEKDIFYVEGDDTTVPTLTGSDNTKKFFDMSSVQLTDFKSPVVDAGETANAAATTAMQTVLTESITEIFSGEVVAAGGTAWARFYAGTGDDLFEAVGQEGWAKGNKGSDKENGTGKGILFNSEKNTGQTAVAKLKADGSAGSASIKVAVPEDGKIEEYVLNVKIVKAVNKGNDPVVIKKSGSKTFIDGDALTEEKNISGFEIRTTNTVTVENGTVGNIKDSGNVVVNGGRVGSIDAKDDAEITISEDGIAGDILNAQRVTVSEGGRVGKILSGDVTLNEGTIAEINTDGVVSIEGGTVTGDVRSEKSITITSEEEDSNDNPLDTIIGGNVIGSGDDAVISIDNLSDDGNAEISIGGYVLARYVDTEDVHSNGTVEIGSADTTGSIRIKGAVEGEYVVLGGNGLLNLAGVRAANEVDHSDKDGEIIESTLKFAGFNSAINSISNFADVIVDEGTVTVKGAVNASNLTVGSDAQIVADSMTIEEDIIDSGSIVVPVGKLTVTGSVDDSPSLALLGDVAVDTLAFAGNRGLVNAFESGGITFKAQRQSDGNYNYLVEKVELGGLTAVGKDVALGVGQTKTVSLALDGTLPEGASIEWSVDDSDVATITGNGMTATITGKEIDDTTVTAKIVDANGRDLGYEDANFEVNVLGVDTVDSIGGDIGPDDNELDLDTKKKNMEAGQVYTFMVRGNNDVENISVTSGDTNVATVALANGTDSRGALYNITAVADGKTDITVTYQGKTSKIAVKVGGFQLDTSSKKMAPGQVYSVLAKNVPADQAGNVTLAYDSNIVDVVKVNDNYNGRGVLFNVTAKAIGETEVKVTHNGETETMAVNVVENTGRLTLDTASYTMPFGGSYTIGVKVEKNGRQLSGEEVRAMITSGELVVTDSRTGSIVTTEVQANGNVRVTGRQNEGTTYVQFIVMQNGQRVTHASVGVTVQNGATAGGSSVRSISQW